MKQQSEIDAEIAHVEYAQTVLTERLTALAAERDLLREDKFAKQKLTKNLVAFFKAHGLYIVSTETGARSDDHYGLAKQLWRAQETLLPFIKTLSKNKKKVFTYDIKALSPTEKTDIKNFCDNLRKQEGLLYEMLATEIKITPSLKGHHKQFFSGAWAEEVTLYLIDKALKKFTQSRKLPHTLYWDVRLKQIDSIKDNSHDMQLDLVAEVKGRFYIFETKSGFVLSIDKWVDRTRLFDGDKSRFITCVADKNLNPMIFKPFKLFALATLEEQFGEMLNEDFPAPTLAALPQ